MTNQGSTNWYKEMTVKLKTVTKELRAFSWLKKQEDLCWDKYQIDLERLIWFGKYDNPIKGNSNIEINITYK